MPGHPHLVSIPTRPRRSPRLPRPLQAAGRGGEPENSRGHGASPSDSRGCFFAARMRRTRRTMLARGQNDIRASRLSRTVSARSNVTRANLARNRGRISRGRRTGVDITRLSSSPASDPSPSSFAYAQPALALSDVTACRVQYTESMYVRPFVLFAN
ncbi:uncharacterized protein TRAVEDRAFT_55378 [Trametes versicolor FP-101664 SS1]|uniref:uncharacterized protein n=1 Tax=Trametes versicolor (strain FP-101664) TaxID=717944 RepID=UPI0004624791|nr:uncharacterized protein TRAVEDRAFT_55378 [Trametes versicolor FP-101664 SS1]EIW64461.1 hypothetical protein TRAVEDRAFT_55378 [Trametes versicolor FP-101664 SS1]